VLVGQEETFPVLITSNGFREIAIAHSADEMLSTHVERWHIPLRGRIAG
jgi:hypothetical protein